MFCLVSLKRYELITIHAHYVDHCSWMTMHKTIFFLTYVIHMHTYAYILLANRVLRSELPSHCKSRFG